MSTQSSDWIFAETEVEVDGVIWKAGEPCICFGDGSELFSHGIVLGFCDKSDKDWGVWARVARPYAYASSTGTTAPNALLGAEVYDIAVKSLKRFTRNNYPRVVHP